MKLNGKTYTMGNLGDFNTMADLQKNGCDISIIDTFSRAVKTKPLYALREMVAIVCNITPMAAGKEIEEYFKHGGNTDKLVGKLNAEVDEYLKKYVDKPIQKKSLKQKMFRK